MKGRVPYRLILVETMWGSTKGKAHWRAGP